MSNLSTFTFDNSNLRVIDNQWFVAKDICDGLDIKDSAKAVRDIEQQIKQTGTKDAISNRTPEKDVAKLDTPATISSRISIKTGGGKQSVICVNETGVNLLIFQSRKKSAFAYKYWIASEVLPQIRKTGKYEIPAEPPSLTKAQAGHIYQTVMAICAKRGLSYQKVFGELKREFQASSYKDIPSKYYGEVCEFLGVHPIEGELMPRNQLEAPKQGKTITAKDEHHIASLCYYVANISQEWEEIALALKNLQSPLATRMNGWVIDGKQFAKIVQYNVKPRFYEPMH